MSTSLSIIAVADKVPTHDYLIRGFSAFLRSSQRYGYEPIILGMGQLWRGLGSKPKLLKKAIEDGTITTDRIIFADAYDVWFAAPPEDISFKHEEFNCDIVWNAEKDCFPDASLAESFVDHGTSFRYLNSGLSIGKTSSYLECLTEMEVDSWPDDHQLPDGRWQHKNDQDDWSRRFLFGQCPGQATMKLDSRCQLFQTLTGMTTHDFDFSEGIKNKETGCFPLAFHANGGSKTSGVMEPILQHLGL